MGMFGDLECQVPLPDGFVDMFQTKDLDCELTMYRITSAGRLVRLNWDSQARVYGEPTDLNYHGMLNFYGGSSANWHEYDAKFTDGQLVEIVLNAGRP